MSITPEQLTAILRKMDAEATKSEHYTKTTSLGDLKAAHSNGARQMRKAMSMFVYGIGAEHFEGKPFIDFRIPMPEEYE